MADFRRARWGPAHVPDRAGDRGAVGLRERRDGARALPASRASRREDVLAAIEFVGLEGDPATKVGTLGAATAGWSRSRARSSASRAWCCSTSPPPACPTRRPSTSAG